MMHTPKPDARVAIVGAGPVGLTLAALLSKSGISTSLYDKAPHLLRKGSKACLIQGDSLEVLDKIGCAAQIAEEGIAWRNGHVFLNDIELMPHTFPERPGFSQFVNISQYRIEQELLRHLEQDPLCTLYWDHEVVGLHQTSSGVTLDLRNEDQSFAAEYLYVVACDGVYSTVRDLMGLEFPGYTHQNPFLITDIRACLPMRKERHFYFNPAFHRGHQMVMHPQPDNIWRIDWQLEKGADIAAERENGGLDKRIRKVIGDVPYNIEWISTYQFNQKVMDRFVAGRVLFAGDAAHALPPYGSRGMNSGIQDADNLAWKLSRVLNGTSDPGILSIYSDERRAAAVENVRLTEATMRFIAPADLRSKAIRHSVLFLARLFPAARKWIDHGKMSEPFTYTSSEMIGPKDFCPIVGHFLPDLPVFLENKRSRLRKLLGDEFTCLIFPEQSSIPLIRDVRAPLGKESDVRFVIVHRRGDTHPQEPASSYEQADRIANYDDIVGAQKFVSKGACFFIIRPDGYIASYHAISELSRLKHHLCRASMRIETPAPHARPVRANTDMEEVV
ncbi:FAD-dependent oxidoreductase [Tateyamaria omphalii]|uniref:FAD-dependent monooxygenase n=1 Tax=Tateyamaria omphalii TaxID=299262 RepID=UPI0016795D5E|nr:FAD-dependent monooxygenase [Tateyamaria omphalii]GGX38042.1 FAD-dependent oxidoreductase [Tateyamaria omphalii]